MRHLVFLFGFQKIMLSFLRMATFDQPRALGSKKEEMEIAPPPLPIELAEKFVDGSFLEDLSSVDKSDQSKTVYWFDRGESLPETANAKLRIEYHSFNDPDFTHPHQVRFAYVRPDPSQPNKQRAFGEMHLMVYDHWRFELQHRYVLPELRFSQGIGTKLFKETEGWLQQVAQTAGHDVMLDLKTGQPNVIVWAQKMGFEIDEDQRGLLEEIKSNTPNDFFSTKLF